MSLNKKNISTDRKVADITFCDGLLYTLYLLLSTLYFIPSTSYSQDQFPKGYFMFPLKPGQVNYLSANMGEMRPNHFHSGLDVKTDYTTGLAVYAAAEGYVSRIRVSSFGYGKTIYITHPNTMTTVYAHLDKFNSVLAEYVKKKQYELQSFEIDYYPVPNELPVTKGQLIARSGNSGSSGGPHLHFEIRDKEERLLNPLMFGFPEMKDQLSPVFDKVAIKPLDITSRVNQEFSMKEFVPYKSGNTYLLPASVKAHGTVGILLKVHDRMNDTHNKYGVNCIELKIDGKEVFYHNLKSFDFYESKYINVHIDYDTYINRGLRLEKCYIDDGDKLSTYNQTLGNGKITLSDNTSHQVEINIYDAFGNSSTLKFTLQAEPPLQKVIATSADKTGYWLNENILKITAPVIAGKEGTIYSKGIATPITPAYHKVGNNIYLHDMRTALPDSFVAGSFKQLFNFVDMIPPGKAYTFQRENITLEFSDTTLFDTLYLSLKTDVMENGRETFQINSTSTPMFGKVRVTYCPHHAVNKNEKCYFYTVNGSNHSFEGGDWDDNVDNLVYNTKYLGKFTVKKDTIQPVIKLKYQTSTVIKFSIFDAGSGIGSYRATLNGQWLLMNYDHKTSSLWSEQLNSNLPLKGTFELEVIDRSGNKSTFRKELL